ncbi:MAG: YbaB/EbfC family nucleoid-associated protein [Myxococcota bacterium]
MSQPPGDLGAMLAQVQQMGERLREAQRELRLRTVEATVGGGVVTARVNGAGELVSIQIDPVAVDPRDVEMLQDLVVAAVGEGMRRARELANEELQRRTGLPIGALLGALGQA